MLDVDRPAELLYSDGEYHVRRRGTYVLCAVTGARIALADLRYWSVERQEAYASAAISLQRHKDAAEGGGSGGS